MINAPYFSNIFFISFEALEIDLSISLNDSLTNSAGYKANIFDISMNNDPIINKYLYLYILLFSVKRCFKIIMILIAQK